MPKGKKQTYKVHPFTIDDAVDLGGILAAGGLTGQAGAAIAQMQQNEGAAVSAITQLVMGALANRTTRDDMRGLLFTLWKTTEDEQATADDLDDETERLVPKYEDGEFKKDSLFYRKRKRFHQLPPSALIGLGKAIYETDGFQDFLESLSTELPSSSSEQPTESNGIMGLGAVK